MTHQLPHVMIVGGGFAGLAAGKALRKTPAKVILIDRTNHHLFQPLLYQVATSVLTPGQIATPIRSILRNQKNTTVLMGEVTAVDKDRNCVISLLTSASDRSRSRSQATLRFSALTGVSAMIETVPLQEAASAYAKMMAGEARFRMVLAMNNGAGQSGTPMK